MSLEENSPSQIKVTTEIVISTGTTAFAYSYHVGTARTWSGDTYETLTISVNDNVGFVNQGFYPEQNLSTTRDEPTITGSWEFNISEFIYESVGFSCQHWEVSRYRPHPDWFLVYSTYLGLGVLVIILVYKGIQRYYS
ncbi:MAG: hypothetical protein R6V83_08530 [Candidatus Thorarchaeota archaeon]